MIKDQNSSRPNELTRTISLILENPWVEILAEGLKLGKMIVRGFTNEGMYEVLDCKTSLELLDRRGEKARVTKREKVRYLQDYTLAYQDQAWGDGKILLN